MKYVTISDKDHRNMLAVDLKHILDVLGDRPAGWTWTVQDLECTGSSAETLHRLSDSGMPVADERLVDLVSDVIQTIDGTFFGYPRNAESPALIIRAVDSSCFDVEAEDAAILRRLQDHFRNVTDVRDVAEGS